MNRRSLLGFLTLSSVAATLPALASTAPADVGTIRVGVLRGPHPDPKIYD